MIKKPPSGNKILTSKIIPGSGKISIFFIFLSFFLLLSLIFPSKITCAPDISKSPIDVLRQEAVLYDNRIYTDSESKQPGFLYTDPIDLYAESALIMDYDTGEVLWEKESSRPLFPASITKIITSIIVLEKTGNLNDSVIISKNASGRNNSFFSFNTGDNITVMDLLKAALISSHNNATIALAEYIAGDNDNFVEMMNEKAKEIGAINTNLQNTNGLDSDFPGHKSTAYDLALIGRYCMHNDIFSKLVGTREDVIKINEEEVQLENTNALLSYGYIKGIKTGYTDNAGYCIINYSEKNGLNLITVVLNSTKEKREQDALNLMDWAYSNLRHEKLIDSSSVFDSITIGDDSYVELNLYPVEDFVRLMHKNNDSLKLEYKLKDDIEIPLERNNILGDITVRINDQPMANIGLINRESVEKPEVLQELTTAVEKQSRLIIIFLLAFYF
ncbi:MAG: D-alanyl-D-alanine carboxypeptidase, partial [Actinobacteria bacterium]|nr:D-alanyl-D-alanine carboxypeptidase [Actinomycetota bacterium]